MSTAAVTFAEEQAVNLGELEPLSVRQERGQLMIDQSVAEKSLQIGERHFSKGLGLRALSEITYELDGNCDRFQAWVGVDASMRQRKQADVSFKVLADGRELFDSGVMSKTTPAKRVDVSLAGAQELKLMVADAPDSSHVGADWADAVLLFKTNAMIPRKILGTTEAFPSPEPAKFQIQSSSLTLELSQSGEIVGIQLGDRRKHYALRGGTFLTGCVNGAVAARQLSNGTVEVTRELVGASPDRGATLIERFSPAGESVRWEIEIRGHGKPWSTGIETCLLWPETKTAQVWTAWEDPEQRHDVWRDPLVMKPLIDRQMWYGALPWLESPISYLPSPKIFVVPIVTVAEPKVDTALSLALSPADNLFELKLTTSSDGSIAFTRYDNRISATNVVKFAMDIVGHAADWRGGLGWMTRRYPEYFNPPNPKAHEIAGLGAYSDWEGELDVARFKQMGFRVNWKASYDFPYMGMFMPPIGDNEPFKRLIKNNYTTIAQVRDYSARMRKMGFYVLSYFDATEFGAETGMPKEADPTLAPADRWKNVHNFLENDVDDGIWRDRDGKTCLSWQGCILMDCGAPKYHAFLLEQARRLIDKIPDASGICIDRLDWLKFYNLHADDGVSWYNNQASRSYYMSWRGLLSDLGPMFHSADKVIFVNALVNRTDALRDVDGIYHEFGFEPTEINGCAFQCVDKPCIAWTTDETKIKPDADSYFQRHLYLGIYPTAPMPANDHTILPGTWADQYYLDYGPLFDLLRGRKWVLIPHVLEVENQSAKANLFEVPDGLVIPVCFGGANKTVRILLHNLPAINIEPEKMECWVSYPGQSQKIQLKLKIDKDRLQLKVPLQRGCAMAHIVSIK
ncbi:MAG TPA: NPCBM/NEW2 domain-containing protein [Verrucomicrobiae bacterium]|nr:NPCBM/NEW2 domain-containing protein [Verrucomicrobiae bacterium]